MSPYDALIQAVATHYDLDPGLLTAQVLVESDNDPLAFRFEAAFFDHYLRDKPAAAGAKYGPLAACSYGLLQILLETALEHGFDDRPERLFDPRVGLAWGAKYLSSCLGLTNHDYPKALARYNGTGPAASAYARRVYAAANRPLPGVVA